jgi:hypothetical protein
MQRVTYSHHHTNAVCSNYLPWFCFCMSVSCLHYMANFCKQCIFMVLKFFIKCGDVDLLKTYDNENVLGLSNHDLKKILDSWFSVQFLL